MNTDFKVVRRVMQSQETSNNLFTQHFNALLQWFGRAVAGS
jgi:hypothetical protein